MKYTITILLILFNLYSSYSQKKENMKTFDIENFNKNKENNEYFFTTSEGIHVKQYSTKIDYTEIRQHKDSLFEYFSKYNLKGSLIRSVKRFPNSFAIGILKDYDGQGNLVEEIDFDKYFNCNWEDIKQYLEKHSVDDIKKQVVSITRWGDKEEAFWTLQFNGTYQDIVGRFKIKIDGKTGEELEVKLFKGKKSLRTNGNYRRLSDIIYKRVIFDRLFKGS